MSNKWRIEIEFTDKGLSSCDYNTYYLLGRDIREKLGDCLNEMNRGNRYFRIKKIRKEK